MTEVTANSKSNKLGFLLEDFLLAGKSTKHIGRRNIKCIDLITLKGKTPKPAAYK